MRWDGGMVEVPPEARSAALGEAFMALGDLPPAHPARDWLPALLDLGEWNAALDDGAAPDSVAGVALADRQADASSDDPPRN